MLQRAIHSVSKFQFQVCAGLNEMHSFRTYYINIYLLVGWLVGWLVVWLRLVVIDKNECPLVHYISIRYNSEFQYIYTFNGFWIKHAPIEMRILHKDIAYCILHRASFKYKPYKQSTHLNIFFSFLFSSFFFFVVHFFCGRL